MTLTFVLALIALVVAVLIISLITLHFLWLKEVQPLLKEQNKVLYATITRLQKLADAMDATTTRLQKLAVEMTKVPAFYKEAVEGTSKPSSEPEPEPEPPNLPTVTDLSYNEVWYILNHILAENDGRVSRRAVNDAGFSRGNYEALRDELQRQGYLEQHTSERQSIDWTDKGRDLLESIEESDWEPK
jgi:predicted transcriptional regulator